LSLSRSSYRLFAVVPPGIEQIAAMELRDLGIEGSPEPGGVSFHGGNEELYRANFLLRTPNRILLRVAGFRTGHLRELAARVSRYPWEIFIPEGGDVRIRATSHRSGLYHTGAVSDRVVDGISRRLRRPVSAGSGDVRSDEGPAGALVVVRIVEDRCTVSVDSSGEPLHRRGYRLAGSAAPIRENLAAAALLSCGWRGDRPFLDPLCGSGTMVIEAALMASRIPPGARRSFAFERWRSFDPEAWERVREGVQVAQTPVTCGMFGRDRDPRSIRAAEENAGRAGIGAIVDFAVSDMEGCVPPCPRAGLLLTNPPYGVRLDAGGLGELYRRFGKMVAGGFRGWRCAVIVPWHIPDNALGLPVRRLLSFSNGGIPVRLLEFTP